MKYVDFVGIDVSKSKLDVHLHKVGVHQVLSNDAAGFNQLKIWLSEYYSPDSSILFCFEYTGLYSEALHLFFQEQQLPFVVVCGLEVKRSMGIRRGKSDKIDAEVLANYVCRHHDDLRPGTPKNLNILLLKKLFSLRNLLVKQRAAYKALIKEKERIEQNAEFSILVDIHQQMRDVLTEKIDMLENRIQEVIQSDERMAKNMELACSIKGIGPQTALYMLVITENFQRFSTWRKFACYAGIAPFQHQSGSSIKRKAKVSHLANKKMKALLSSAAATAIQSNPELKRYYWKRLEQGRNKMATLNIIRNKLVARVFAVVNRQTPYVQLNFIG